MPSISVAACRRAFIALLLVGCAPVVPRELADARVAYNRVRLGPAARVAAAELEMAKELLVQAELAFIASPGAQDTRDLAYRAEHRALFAEVMALRALGHHEKAQPDSGAHKDHH